MKESLKEKTDLWEDVEEINDDNKHLFPKELQDAYDLCMSDKDLFPRKTQKVKETQAKLAQGVINQTKDILDKNPNLYLSEVLAIFLKKWPPYIGSYDLIQYIQLIDTEIKKRKEQKLSAQTETKTKAA